MFRTRFLCALWGLFASLVVCAPAASQSVVGHLEGRVISADSLPMPALAVNLSGALAGGDRSTLTDQAGRFRFPAILVGRYQLEVAGPGVRTVRIEAVSVHLGERTVLPPIEVMATPIELEPVVVVADASTVDRASTTLGSVFVTDRVADLPLGRDYQSTVTLLPHANTSYLGDGVAVSGSTGLENLYFVDGVNVTTPYQATGSTRLPYNFVTQVRVKGGGYSVRDGGALGAIIEAVTHTGSNEFEVDAFGFFTNKALAADARTGLWDLEERHFATYDVGVRISGPLVRDRLWYSAAYNPLFERRERKALNLGFFDDRRVEHRLAAKLNWRAGPSTDVEATVFGDPTGHDRVAPFSPLFTTTTLVNPDPFLWRREDGGVNHALRAAHRWTGGVVEASFAASMTREHSFGRTETARSEPFFHDPGTGETEGGVLWDERVDGDRRSFTLRSTLFSGAHSLTLGGTYALDEIDYAVDQPDPGLVLDFGSGFVAQRFRQEFPDLRNRAPAIYLEDRWEIHDRLVVTAGVRWESQALIATGDSVAQAFNGLWQPRVAASLDLDRRGRHRLFASAGRFYQRIPLQGAVFFYSEPPEGPKFYSEDPRSPGATPVNELPPPTAADKVENIEGEHHDQVVAGWEGSTGTGSRLSVRGVLQVLREAWMGAFVDPNPFRWTVGNPGRGALSSMPRAKRRYAAVEVSAERTGVGPLDVRASYVYSRSRGNYTGLFSSDVGVGQPNNNWTFRCPLLSQNSEGPLPGDRPHVLKVLASYAFGSGVTGGAFFSVQSGSPLSEFAHDLACTGSPPGRLLAAPRGSAGRLPSFWDLDLRFTAPMPIGADSRSRIVVDLLNVGNPKRIVAAEQLRWLVGGAENPAHGAALVHQPPMILRVGFEFGM